jgi:hypothetical protein
MLPFSTLRPQLPQIDLHIALGFGGIGAVGRARRLGHEVHVAADLGRTIDHAGGPRTMSMRSAAPMGVE